MSVGPVPPVRRLWWLPFAVVVAGGALGACAPPAETAGVPDVAPKAAAPEDRRAFLRPLDRLDWPAGAEGTAGLYLSEPVPVSALGAAFVGPPSGRARLARFYFMVRNGSGSAMGEDARGSLDEAVAAFRRQLGSRRGGLSAPGRLENLFAPLDTVSLEAFRASHEVQRMAASLVSNHADARLAERAASGDAPVVVGLLVDGTQAQVEAVASRLPVAAYADLRAAEAAGVRGVFVPGLAGAGARLERERAVRDTLFFGRLTAGDPALVDSLYRASTALYDSLTAR